MVCISIVEEKEAASVKIFTSDYAMMAVQMLLMKGVSNINQNNRESFAYFLCSFNNNKGLHSSLIILRVEPLKLTVMVDTNPIHCTRFPLSNAWIPISLLGSYPS